VSFGSAEHLLDISTMPLRHVMARGLKEAVLLLIAAWVVWSSNKAPGFASIRGDVHSKVRAAGPFTGVALESAVAGAPPALQKQPSSYVNVHHAALSALACAFVDSVKQAFRARKGQLSHDCRVVMHARTATPSSPASSSGNRRQLAGKKNFMLNENTGKMRQIKVRVNPKTNKPIRYPMHVRPGDIIQVQKGKDAGKVAEVWKIYSKWNKVTCIGVNYCIKHVRPMRQDEVGQRVQVEAPMHASNVMHYSEKEGVAGLLGIKYEMTEDGTVKKIRYNKATNEEIPDRRRPKWTPVLERDDEDDE